MQAMAILKEVDQETGQAPAAKIGHRKRDRSSSSLAKMLPVACKVEDVCMSSQLFPTSSSAVSPGEESRASGLDWPSSGPFTYQRWLVLIEQ